MASRDSRGSLSILKRDGDQDHGTGHLPDEQEATGFPTISLRRAQRLEDFSQHLGYEEAIACLELIHQSLNCRTREDLSALVGELGKMLEADYCACMLSSRAPLHAASRVLVADGTFPAEWIKLYFERQFQLVDPIMMENYSSFSLQYWSDTYRRHPPPKMFASLAEDFGLTNGLTFGSPNPPGDGGSLFTFSGPRLKSTSRNLVIQRLVLPHLHQALCHLDVCGSQLALAPSLSPREREVLKWIGAGKSSWEAGMILRISERTVNFHLMNILRKLDVVNRPQAVAMALKLGLLELP
jgi:DNA-binding CsgD family transcriptional regulator